MFLYPLIALVAKEGYLDEKTIKAAVLDAFEVSLDAQLRAIRPSLRDLLALLRKPISETSGSNGLPAIFSKKLIRHAHT